MPGSTTITALRTSLLRIPFVGAPPANGIMPPTHRELLVLEIETAGGLSGMGYLQPLSGGLFTLAPADAQAKFAEIIAAAPPL